MMLHYYSIEIVNMNKQTHFHLSMTNQNGKCQYFITIYQSKKVSHKILDAIFFVV
jgi:hypothetical protein